MKLVVISICKDEAATIGQLVRRIPQDYPGVDDVDICVIDDGSSDKTAAVARKAGATVYQDGTSKGLAFRFREAVDIALAHGADIMVNIDGDLQFQPEDIPLIISPIVKKTADFVAADRFTDAATAAPRRPKNMPAVKYYGNRLGARVLSHLSGQTFSDVTCGFRAYGYEALIALNLHSTHTYTQESFQLIAAKRLRIATIPITVTYYEDRESRVVKNPFNYIAVSSVNILRAYRDFAPLRFFTLMGCVPFVLGLAGIGIALGHWLVAGSISPYKAFGITGLYLVTLGIFFWGTGLAADLVVRLQGTQEKIYEDMKRLRFPRQ